MMLTNCSFKHKSSLLSLFLFFLWISGLTFGMIFSEANAFAQEKLYNIKGKRDPFVQLIGASSKASTGGLLGVETLEEILIEGIVNDSNPKNSILVTNGMVMKEGDEVGNVKLLKIDPNGALFSVNGMEGYKTLYQEKNDKSANDKKN